MVEPETLDLASLLSKLDASQTRQLKEQLDKALECKAKEAQTQREPAFDLS